MSSKAVAPPTLAEYVLAKKRAACPVCQLSDAVKTQLRESGNKKNIRRAEMIGWLRDALNIAITDGDLNAHYSGRHEAA